MSARIFGGLGILLIVAAIVASQAFFIVDETKQAMVLQFGDPVSIIRSPGLATKAPFIQNVTYFEKRVLSSDAIEQEYLTRDKKRLVVDHVTRWQIVDPLLFFTTVTTEAGARARLDDIVFSELREQLALVDFVDVIADQRENIMERVARSAATKSQEFGINVLDVRTKRADLPEAVQQSVYNRMIAERNRESSLFRAEGEEQKAIIEAQATRDKNVIEGEGVRAAQRIQGAGEGYAACVYAVALEQNPEFYAFWRRLQAYQQTLKEGDSVIVPSDSDFFHFLTKSQFAAAEEGAAPAEAASVGQAAESLQEATLAKCGEFSIDALLTEIAAEESAGPALVNP